VAGAKRREDSFVKRTKRRIGRHDGHIWRHE
jgi:hypothetical protein